jgi:hypothetical protein
VAAFGLVKTVLNSRAPGSSCSHASRAKASRQNLAFRFTPMLREVLLQSTRAFGGAAQGSPSTLIRGGPSSPDRRQDQTFGRFADLKADA